ncbi:MAG TPA: hypothetical protein PLS12_06055 [Bacteroidales bacterium]|nr:hypothetical protein [Bacteroidales bacterium]
MTIIFNIIGFIIFSCICIGLATMLIWAVREFSGKNPTWFN